MKRLLLATALAFAALGGIAQAQAPLSLGAFDPALSGQDRATVDRFFGLGRGAGVGIVRIDARWSSTAPRRPAAPQDPGDPAYDFSRIDAQVASAQAQGMRIMLAAVSAPSWAEGPGRVSSAPAGTWRPNAAALGDFAVALARRYPQVSAFAAWNEPNLDTYLSPQWRNGRPVSPAFYRGMLNRFYAGIKSVRPRALVVAGSTSPFGDLNTSGRRMPPARFVRELLCLKGDGRPAPSCAGPARFDVLDHHPYSTRGPFSPALNGDDVTVPDIARKLGTPLRRAVARGYALPRKTKRLWVTEISWDSSPPDPDGVPSARHALWLSQSMYVLWRQGVDTVMWFLIRDQAPEPSFAATYQSGLFLRDGRPKLAARAFRFPFVAVRTSRGLRLWGRAPTSAAVVLERRTGSRWTQIASIGAGQAGRVFERGAALRAGDRVRAGASGVSSLVVTVP